MLTKLWKNYRLPIILLISIIIGSIIGGIMGEDAKVLEPFGSVFVNMLFVIVIPLVFSTIAGSISNMGSLKRLGKILKYMLFVFIVTSLIAATFMLLGVLIFKPTGSVLTDIEYTKEKITELIHNLQFMQLRDIIKSPLRFFISV